MSVQVLAVSNSTKNVQPKVNIRRSANYHPSIWGDYFLRYASESKKYDNSEEEFWSLKEEVNGMLLASTNEPLQKLNLIDKIQRLGVSYHFESEIDELLRQFLYQPDDVDGKHYNDHIDLEMIALRFRLLRQQGLNVSSSVFNKFKNTDGAFKGCVVSDVKGMLSLYEAAHLRVHGENMLDDALVFTTTHLKSIMTTNLNPPLLAQVKHALKQPIRKGLPWLEARHYISIYEQEASYSDTLLNFEQEASYSDTLLNFAKLNFNMIQKMHQKELANITMWWKELDFARKLPFARDRLVECYFWILGVCYEPQYSFTRKIMTKVIALTSIADDIYDVYGTMEELELLTVAIERWDVNSIHHLPEYMKFWYEALLNTYGQIEEELAEQGWSYRVHYAKESMKKQVQAYFVEAKWLHENYIPTMDEYMRISLVSCGYYLLTCASFVGMGDIVTENAFGWLSNDPKIVRAASVINRLMDDIVSHKFEQERGHVASGVECYMNQYEGVSEQQVYNEFRKQVENAWKDINEEFFRLIDDHVPIPLLTRVLNLARVMDVLYKDEDGYTNAKGTVKIYITSLLIEPVPLATSVS